MKFLKKYLTLAESYIGKMAVLLYLSLHLIVFSATQGATAGITLYAFEILIFPICLWMLFTKKYRPSKQVIYLLGMLALLFVYMVGINLIRGDANLFGQWPFRMLACGIAMYYLIDAKMVKFKDAVRGLILFNTFILLWQTLALIFVPQDLRNDTLMGNVNLYFYTLLALVPLNVHVFFGKIDWKMPRVMQIFAGINVLAGFAYALISGSRVLWAFMPILFIIAVLFVERNIKKRLVAICAVAIYCAIMFSGILTFDWFGARINVYRAYSFNGSQTQQNDPPHKTSSSQPGLQEGIERATQSDAIRMQLWETSMDSFKKAPIIGPGVDYVYTMGQRELSHNAVLEVLLPFGIIGLMIYILIYGSQIKLIFKKRTKSKKFCFCIGISVLSILVVSMIQCLLVHNIHMLLLVWSSFALLRQVPEEFE